jgi:hypothetical protein
MIGRIFLRLQSPWLAGVRLRMVKRQQQMKLSNLAERPVYKYTEDFRTRFIYKLAKYCQKILDALPTNTPAGDLDFHLILCELLFTISLTNTVKLCSMRSS